jgi:CRP/FNR family transcriptional regulator, anaerobic regulatory protein
MFDKLRTYFEQSITLTDEQFALMQQCYIPRKMKRGEFLMRAGEVAQYGAFVARGCLRSYHIDEKGKEHILQFAPENWWISDMGSLLNQEPSLYFIDAVEDSDALLVDVPSLHNLIERIPQFAEHYRLGLQKHAAAKNRRIISTRNFCKPIPPLPCAYPSTCWPLTWALPRKPSAAYGNNSAGNNPSLHFLI